MADGTFPQRMARESLEKASLLESRAGYHGPPMFHASMERFVSAVLRRLRRRRRKFGRTPLQSGESFEPIQTRAELFERGV